MFFQVHKQVPRRRVGVKGSFDTIIEICASSVSFCVFGFVGLRLVALGFVGLRWVALGCRWGVCPACLQQTAWCLRDAGNLRCVSATNCTKLRGVCKMRVSCGVCLQDAGNLRGNCRAAASLCVALWLLLVARALRAGSGEFL